ncbi:pectin lyase fold/virulence factor [Rhizoctonia solani]|nr:pectin lyase fold/virulence factor [Rhizoctonia solani]
MGSSRSINVGCTNNNINGRPGSLAALLVASRGALAIGTPYGFTTATTGGGGAPRVTPTSAAQLKGFLADNTARTIILDRTYDFTDSEGSATETGCKPWSCSPNPQLAINANNWCASSAAKVKVTYKKAGTSGLANIRISDINAQYIWRGDAIDLQGVTNVWIDHNHFKDVGRQFIVTHFNPDTKVTISNNYFDGQATWSTGCDKHHYWVFLMLGKNEQMTLAHNYIHCTSDRGPHIGGTSGNKQLLHIYFNDVTGHALDPGVGSSVLAEGNYFNKVQTPLTGNKAGAVFAPTSSSMVNPAGSGALTNSANSGVISQFNTPAVKGAWIMDPSAVTKCVLANAGTGKVA